MAPRKKVEFAADIDARDIRTYLALKKALDEKRAREATTGMAEKRAALLEECPHPLALAQKFDQTIVSTPAMEIISNAWVETFNTYNGRLQVSCPPQMGKSTVAQYAIWWALIQNPNRRVVFASYSMSLARKSSWAIRNLVSTHGAEYGLELEPTRHDVANWRLAHGFIGGLTARGVEAGLTGEPCDLMVVDDLLAGEEEAQSKTIREKVDDWWSFVARTRMAPGVPAVAIGTRWHHQDILARFIREGWSRINIPAISDGKTEDILNRPPGVWLESTRGHSADDWLQLQKDTSVRAWQSLYMGNPVPIEGSIFRQEWFDTNRLLGELPHLRSITIGVDPADTGTGDEAGILVAGTTLSGELVVLADLSGRLGEFAWARTACIAWVEWDANRILQERQTGFRTSIDTAWSLLHRQAVALVGYGSPEAAAAVLLDGGDPVAADLALLREIEHVAEKIVDIPSGPRVVSQTPKQAKIVRAESAAGMFQRGRARIYGYLPKVEFECVSLVENYKESPGRVDVLSMLTIAELKTSKSAILV